MKITLLSSTGSEQLHPDDRAGFTRIELFVIVATLALVGCLLLPAMARTATGSQSYQCINRLRQLTGAVMMYSHDFNDFLPPNPDDGNISMGYNWCPGQAGLGGADEFDPDLLADPQRTLVAPYLNLHAEVFHCPADNRVGKYDGTALYPSSGKIGTQVLAARSVSMNSAIGTMDPCFANEAGHCGAPRLPVDGPWLTGTHGANSATKGPWRTYGKTSQMTAPTPETLWILIDEDSSSINDASFAMSVGSPVWLDYPASRHDRSASVGFADAHVELHRWISPSTILTGPPSLRNVTTNNPDWLWLSVRSSAKLH